MVLDPGIGWALASLGVGGGAAAMAFLTVAWMRANILGLTSGTGDLGALSAINAL